MPESAKNNPSNRKDHAADNDKAESTREYNPRWTGYSVCLLSSLLNFIVVGNVAREHDRYRGNRSMALSFGVCSFVFCALVLIQDRTHIGINQFDYLLARKGRWEGYSLLFWTLWWIVGVAYLTQVNGVAYQALNVFFSSWLCLAAVIYTLNDWSSQRDLLSVQELTGVSATLGGWYILFMASLVVFGTSIQMYTILSASPSEEAMTGIVFGGTSSLLSLGFILVHYRLLDLCLHGGWLELSVALILSLTWIVGCAILTRDGAIGATIAGTGCFSSAPAPLRQQESWSECYVVFNITPYLIMTNNPNNSTNNSIAATTTTTASSAADNAAPYPCVEFFQEPVPGSNLYLSTWTCLFASFYILLRWKAQQALKVAQAAAFQRNRGATAPTSATTTNNNNNNSVHHNDEEEDFDGLDNDGLSDFQDAES